MRSKICIKIKISAIVNLFNVQGVTMKLTATEHARFSKFVVGMSQKTIIAMRHLFEITKPGRQDIASALITAAHEKSSQLNDAAIAYLKPLGLVQGNGQIPKSIREAVQKAVSQGYLIINGPNNPYLKPSSALLNPSYE